MSTNQSNLSSAQFGYDFVVATTQAAINATMLEFLNETTMPLITMYYNQDDKGNPVLVDRVTLLSQTNGTDPLLVQNWSSSSPMTDDIKNLSNSDFWYAFQARIGMPPGFLPSNLPDIVTLEAGSQSVNFSLLCSEFTVVESTYSRNGLTNFLNTSQPSGTAWVFTSNVPLANIINNDKLPPAVQQQLDYLGSDAFSVQQLFFDLDSAILESTPTLSGIVPGTAVSTALNQIFQGAYFSAMKANGQPILGYSIVPKTSLPDPSPLSLTGLNFEVSPYLPPANQPNQPDLNTLNYLCASNNDTLPQPVSFNWNWIDQEQAGLYDGVIAVNRNTLASYFEQQLKGLVPRNCFLPWVRVWLSDWDTKCNWGWNMIPGQSPDVAYPATGDTVLTFSYEHPQVYDSAGLDGDMGSGGLATQYSLSVRFVGNTIIIVQHLVINIYVSSLSDGHGGNVVDKTITDTYTIAVNQQGALTVSDPASAVLDNSDPPSTNGFLSFFNGLNDIINDVNNWITNYTATSLTDIPASHLRNFIFPGGKVFTYTDVGFSANQDLVSHITYVDPV